MAKDTEEIEDEKVVPDGNEAELREAAQEPQEPKDLRSTLKDAMKEVSEKEEAEVSDEKKDDDKPERRESQQRIKEAKDRKSETELEVSDNKKEKEVKSQIEPPPFYKNKGKALWDKLTDEDRKFLATREKEVSDGFAQYSPKVKAFEELEPVIAPRRQMIRDFGATEAQTVDRLFQWMENLAHPNASHRVSSFKQLAQSFGVDINQLAPRSTTPVQPTEGQQPQVPNNEPPEYFQQYAGAVAQEVNGLKARLENQDRAAADAFVLNWANATNSEGEKVRPYFDQVRLLMAQISMPKLDNQGRVIGDAIVPLKNGMIDLDAAYDAAVKLHPEIAAQIQQAAQEKAAKKAEEKAKADAKDKAARLAKARNAGSGLKPAASSMAPVSASNNRSVNGTGGKKSPSIRDSLKEAWQEVSER